MTGVLVAILGGVNSPVIFASAGALDGQLDDGAGLFTLTPGAPAGVGIGNLLFLQVQVFAAGASLFVSVTTPSGWTNVASLTDAGPDHALSLFYRWATGTADDTPTVTAANDATAATSVAAARLYRFSGGLGSGDPRDGPAGAFQAASTTLNAQDITTTTVDALACQFVGVFSYAGATGSFTGETGTDYTEVATANTTVGADMTMQLQVGTKPVAGAITGGTYTLGSSQVKAVAAFGLKAG